MRLWLLCMSAGFAPYTLFAMTESDGAVAIVSALLGGGGIFGVVKLWLSSSANRDKRADDRLSEILVAARQEREKDREGERAERAESMARFDAALQRSATATDALTDEVRGLRMDVKSGSGCRAGTMG